VTPDRVTTNAHHGYPRALRTELGGRVRHRTNRYLNNRLEQDHRGIKSRCRPTLGFKSVQSANRYYRGHDELGTFCAADSACANTFPPLRGAFTACAEQPSRSVSWNLLERKAPQSEHVARGQARTLTDPARRLSVKFAPLARGRTSRWCAAASTKHEARKKRFLADWGG